MKLTLNFTVTKAAQNLQLLSKHSKITTPRTHKLKSESNLESDQIMKLVLVVHVVGPVLVAAFPDESPLLDRRVQVDTGICDNPLIQPNTGLCEPDYIPDKEPCDGWPSLDNCVLAASPQGFQDAAFFQQLEVDNPNTLFMYDPPGCQPYPLVAQALSGGGVQIPVCEGMIQEESGKSSKSKSSKLSKYHYDGLVQCSFQYEGKISQTKRYNLVQENKKKYTKTNKKSKSRSRTFVTHEGGCGVCSSTQDLAVNLSPTLGHDGFQCKGGFRATIAQDPTLTGPAFGTLTDCYRKMGFSPNCAYIWASNGFQTTLVVGEAGRALQGNILPYEEFDKQYGKNMPWPKIPESCLLCAK